MVPRTFSSRRSLPFVAALALAALPAGSSASGSAGTAVTCRSGPVGGLWLLPNTPGGTGVVDGTLAAPTSAGAYHFVGTLTDVPTPCLSCIEGRIQGMLDDGIGPGPDYLVLGRYTGASLSGSGTFEARIVSPAATSPQGRIGGQFRDAPGDNLPGNFRALWTICP